MSGCILKHNSNSHYLHEGNRGLSRKRMQILILTLSLSTFLSYPLLSQYIESYPQAFSAEKIYLQLDSKVYTNNQTIWFKSVVTNAGDHIPTKLSGVLYVELIGPDERIIEKKMIKLDRGIGEGFFELNHGYPEGVYLVRAYTEWDKNFGNDFFFKEYIRVYGIQEKKNAGPISDVILVKKQDGRRRLKARFNPLALDSLHKKGLILFITVDGKADTLVVKKNRNNKYLIDYALPDTCRLVKMQIRTKNHLSRSKIIVVNEDVLDLQFFPESGEFVHGLQSRTGFKALDYSGKGRSVEGKIIDGEGGFVTFFKSNSLGMGSFIIPKADSGKRYFASLNSQSEGVKSILYPLPEVASLGNVLSVTKKGNKINLRCSSNYLKDDSISVIVSCRGQIYYETKIRLKEGAVVLSLPNDAFPEGVIAFTMTDDSGQPVAERLYFNERPETRLNIALSTDKSAYSQRELTTLNIKAAGHDGEPVDANFSVLVLNKKQMGQLQDMRQNILSYFLLSSDLKGIIENPGFYFSNDNVNRFNYLDVLLLTQGWRKYLYAKPLKKIVYQPEEQLSVSGYVIGAVSRKRKKSTELTVMTFGRNRSAQTFVTDSLGRFNFSVEDEYGPDIPVLVQSANKSGKKKNYTIVINKKKSPAIYFDQKELVERPDSVVRLLVKKNIERKRVEDAYRLSSGTIYLDEVVIQGYKMTPERKEVIEKYGKPDRVIDGKEILAKEEKWSYGLYSVLLFNYANDVIIKRDFNGDLHAEVVGGPKPTLVVIDGLPVLDYNYDRIGIIPPSEVKSFEIIKNAKNFRDLYTRAHPGTRRIDAPYLGSVIAIYTRSGKGLFEAVKPVGIVQTTIPVFSTPREFYAPGYKVLSAEDWAKPDLRALIYWVPKVVTDSLGKGSVSFYNADNTGEMQVVVEAISETGKIGYQELFYNVKKRR